jgi:hypothetical protein
MKDKYTVDFTISPTENLKRLVNNVFQKEIALDVLKGNQPNYENLSINQVNFCFKKRGTKQNIYGKYVKKFFNLNNSNEITHLTLTTYLNKGRKRRHGRMVGRYKVKSIKIYKGEIDIKYLKDNFNKLKSLHEADEAEYKAQEKLQEEDSKIINEIKSKYDIGQQTNTGIYIQNRKEDGTRQFQLLFNYITEDQVRMLISYWHQMRQ